MRHILKRLGTQKRYLGLNGVFATLPFTLGRVQAGMKLISVILMIVMARVVLEDEEREGVRETQCSEVGETGCVPRQQALTHTLDFH